IQDRERAPPSLQISAAYAAVSRLIPSHASSFQFNIVTKEFCGGESCFKLSNYPAVNRSGSPEIVIDTFAWWDWERWEKEIDWMALQGINLPLAFTGQEAIWQKVFQKFNISGSDLSDFFGGPGFLAWSRMGNLHGWGGPLPQSWLDQQLVMQKKILTRMYELGMNPVLPAFSGNVPAALKSVYPSAKITRLGNWFTVSSDTRWCCTYLLDATDPLFVKIGKAFITQQFKEYGRTSHIYNCDTFDENTPPDDDPKYISSLAAAIFRGMESGDDNAVWLMQ
ncbi:hypothetical protein MIMGU_mgv1a0184371mg, partial [Erythranthe guttata]